MNANMQKANEEWKQVNSSDFQWGCQRLQSQVAETLMEVIPGAKNHQNMEGKLLAASSDFLVGGIEIDIDW